VAKLTLTSDEKKELKARLVLCQPSNPLAVTKPTTTASLATKLSPIAANPLLAGLGIGVVDFTNNPTSPRVWLHNGDEVWQIASTAKIAILLAAVQLRHDVRQVREYNSSWSPDELDQIFETIWAESKLASVKQIGAKHHGPRVSTIFDFPTNWSDTNFKGGEIAEPDKVTIGTALNDVTDPLYSDGDLVWTRVAEFTFSERMWMAGANSDNVAAASCASEIGLRYINAVLESYGFENPKKSSTMTLFLGTSYARIKANVPIDLVPFGPIVRQVDRSTHPVPALPNRTTLVDLTIAGSAASLAAFVIALETNKLVTDDPNDTEACDTIRMHLANMGSGVTSFVYGGVDGAASTINDHYSKVGFLRNAHGRYLGAEFNYFVADGLKYGVVATGVRPYRVSATATLGMEAIGEELGKRVHTILLSP
jgi:hypothetical protein